MTDSDAPAPPPLHPTEHRGLREAYVRARHIAAHHARLGERLARGPAADALRGAAETARRLVADLEVLVPERGLEVGPAASGLGSVAGTARNAVADRFLERGQAVRIAAGESDALALLLAYLSRTAEHRGDERMALACADAGAEVAAASARVREAVIAMGADPDFAIEPVDSSPAGRAGQRVGYAIGSVGEWVDRRLGGR